MRSLVISSKIFFNVTPHFIVFYYEDYSSIEARILVLQTVKLYRRKLFLSFFLHIF